MKKFLFSAVDGHGHINSLVGIADWLKQRGHDTVFLMKSDFPVSGHRVISMESMMNEDSTKPKVPGDEALKHVLEEFSKSFTLDPRGINEFVHKHAFMKMFNGSKELFEIMEKCLVEYEPDVILCDYLFAIPPLMNNKHKWVRIQSASPLMVWHKYFPDKVPPAFYGVPTQASREVIREYSEFDRSVQAKTLSGIREASAPFGLQLDENEGLPESPHLNIYMYPRVLDYDRFCGAPRPSANWLRCNTLVRNDSKTFEVPEWLRAKPGALIFLSMGTLASMDLRIMRRLIDILGKMPHKFIVAKGVRHNEYELADNMWGERFVPQLAVLKQVDLIITHGGNNTITECMYYGVPGLIVLPVFADQFDNAQRVQEERLGLRLHPFQSDADQFRSAIDQLLNDQDMKERIKTISQELQAENSIEMAAKEVEKLAL